MQNQKSDSDIDLKTEFTYSPEEETFVNELWLGTNQDEAYRRAYGAEGYSPNSLKVRACQKAAQSKIRAALAKLRAVQFNKTLITVEHMLQDEYEFAQRCENAGNYGAAGAARDRAYKLQGLYQEKFEITTQDPLQLLNEIAKLSPDLARQLAKAQDIQYDPEPRSIN